jgi:hypothetical protein
MGHENDAIITGGQKCCRKSPNMVHATRIKRHTIVILQSDLVCRIDALSKPPARRDFIGIRSTALLSHLRNDHKLS